ncbi:MAG: hypothetical protein OXQ29_09880, partial [Rhodospirillaceae bacterium]|nr:hypothetical protein [Rhodospirillaceae bacterium]
NLLYFLQFSSKSVGIPQGFTFADETSNRNHIRLGYSVIEKSRIPEGIDRIANAVSEAVAEPSSDTR